MKYIFTFLIILFLAGCSTTQKAEEELFTVNIKSPSIQVGSFSGQFEKVLGIGGLRKDDIAVDYYPTEDAVCLQYKNEYVTYHQFWNRSGREAFISALEKYKEDYSQRKFGKSSRKTKQNYGTINGYLYWQLFQYSKLASGSPTIDIGYYFNNKTPYFTINQREAYYLDPISREDNKKSAEILIYFTRAQADSIAAVFDQQFLRGLSANTEK